MTDNDLKWKNRLDRERAARKEAEKLLEDKSRELFELNQSLQVRIEEELLKSKERESFLAEQSKLASMGEMIGNIAHQWRQPLSAITSTASSIKIQLELGIISNDEIDLTLSNIIEKANFLSNTIDDFRNFFQTKKEKADFNIIDIMKNVENIIYATYQNNHISLVQNIPNDNIIYKGLSGELSQVILNIFNNAKDVLVEKNISEKIVKVSIFIENDEVNIKISDNGGGIPKKIIDKIFEPYFTTKHQSQGTGIGLYMSREIIKNHFNGKIYAINEEFEIYDKKHFGAAFIIQLPINT
ncbi:MAG: HAMP domain-containing sensor histidine kinase [Campylobacterota bacterium]|nr:HAMP domain-containing sensor histidine kinase [Campylobacterota bacterium]